MALYFYHSVFLVQGKLQMSGGPVESLQQAIHQLVEDGLYEGLISFTLYEVDEDMVAHTNCHSAARVLVSVSLLGLSQPKEVVCWLVSTCFLQY